ncbi:MAG: hypothetical protein RLZZ263_413, partial [Cyanobacteriota bacterium]
LLHFLEKLLELGFGHGSGIGC